MTRYCYAKVGIPEVTHAPKHTFEKPGKHRVTLIVWDAAGRGGQG